MNRNRLNPDESRQLQELRHWVEQQLQSLERKIGSTVKTEIQTLKNNGQGEQESTEDKTLARREKLTTIRSFRFTVGVAIVALLISGWQGWLTRENNRATVAPELSLSANPIYFPEHPDSGKYQIVVTNTGLGPAYIDSFKVFYNDSEITHEHYKTNRGSIPQIAAWRALYGWAANWVTSTSDLTEKSVLLPKDSMRLIDVNFKSLDSVLVDDVVEGLNRINFKIQYNSVYHDDPKYVDLSTSPPPHDVYPFIKQNYSYFLRNYPELHSKSSHLYDTVILHK